MVLFEENYVRIAQLVKTHGYKGYCFLDIDPGYEMLIGEGKFVFLEIDGYKVPFRIESFQHDDRSLLKLEEINTPEALKPFLHHYIYLPDKDVPLSTKNRALETFESYHIIDQKDINLGPILRIDEYPQQSMAIVRIDGKETLIPLHKSLIISIDHDQKNIYMELPDGLY